MNTTCIYGIRDLAIDKFIYVGKSNDPKHRYGRIGNSHNDCVEKFVEEKGEDNFQVVVLETVEFEITKDWMKREKFWVKKLREEGHLLCNKDDGGGGATEVSEETRAKISGALSGREVTEEHKAKLRESWTPERRQAQSKRLSGENCYLYGKTGEDHPRYGICHTEEWKHEQSERMLGENNPMYGKFGEDNPHYGKKRSLDTRIRLREASLGKGLGNECGAKPYPAFYNIKTGEHIPAGKNLVKLCSEQNLSYGALSNLKLGYSKQSKAGWRLVAKEPHSERSSYED